MEEDRETKLRRLVWAEAKTYTWWLVTLAAILAYVGTSTWMKFWTRAAVTLVGCVIGVAVALVGLRVVRCEAKPLGESASVGALFWRAFGGAKEELRVVDLLQSSLLWAAVAYGLSFVGTLLYALLR